MPELSVVAGTGIAWIVNIHLDQHQDDAIFEITQPNKICNITAPGYYVRVNCHESFTTGTVFNIADIEWYPPLILYSGTSPYSSAFTSYGTYVALLGSPVLVGYYEDTAIIGTSFSPPITGYYNIYFDDHLYFGRTQTTTGPTHISFNYFVDFHIAGYTFSCAGSNSNGFPGYYSAATPQLISGTIPQVLLYTGTSYGLTVNTKINVTSITYAAGTPPDPPDTFCIWYGPYSFLPPTIDLRFHRVVLGLDY